MLVVKLSVPLVILLRDVKLNASTTGNAITKKRVLMINVSLHVQKTHAEKMPTVQLITTELFVVVYQDLKGILSLDAVSILN